MNTYFRCLESRIDKNNTLYGKFSLNSILSGQGNTFANSLRRSLFSDLSGLAITHFCITSKPGLSYEFATLPGLTESILDFSLNLKKVVLTGRVIDHEMQSQENSSNVDRKRKSFPPRSKIQEVAAFYPFALHGKSIFYVPSGFNLEVREARKTTLPISPIGFLKAKGPAVLRAKDLIFPPGIRCVHPDQYLGTIAADGALSIKFLVAAGKGFIVQDETLYNSLSRAKLLLKSNILPEAYNKRYKLPGDRGIATMRLTSSEAKRQQSMAKSNSVLSSRPNFVRAALPAEKLAKQAVKPGYRNTKSKQYSGDPKKASWITPKASIFCSTADKTFLDQKLIGGPKDSQSNATSLTLSALRTSRLKPFASQEVRHSLLARQNHDALPSDQVNVNSLFKDNKKSIQTILPYSAISEFCIQKQAKQFYLLAFWPNFKRSSPKEKSTICEKEKSTICERGAATPNFVLRPRQVMLCKEKVTTNPLATLSNVDTRHKIRSQIDITKLLVSLSPTVKNQKFKKNYCLSSVAKQVIGRSQTFLPLNKNISGSFSNIYLGKLGKSDSSKKLLKKQLIWSAEETLYPVLSLDVTFTPVSKVNFQINVNRNSEKNEETIIFEIWTNGSITPKRAIQESCLTLAQDFYNLFCRVNEFSSLQFWWKRESTESKITSLARSTVENLYPAPAYELTPKFKRSSPKEKSTICEKEKSTICEKERLGDHNMKAWQKGAGLTNRRFVRTQLENSRRSSLATTNLRLTSFRQLPSNLERSWKARLRTNIAAKPVRSHAVCRPTNFYMPLNATVSRSNWGGFMEGYLGTVHPYARSSKLLRIEDFYSTSREAKSEAKQLLFYTAYKNFRRKKENKSTLDQKLFWFNKIIVYPSYAKNNKSSASLKSFMTTSLPSSYAPNFLRSREGKTTLTQTKLAKLSSAILHRTTEGNSTALTRKLPYLHSNKSLIYKKLAQRCTLTQDKSVTCKSKANNRPSFANKQINNIISKTNFRSHSQIKNSTKVQFPENKNLRLKQKVHYLHAFWRLNVSDLNLSLETQLILKKLNVNSVYDLHFFILRKSWSLFLNRQQENEIIKIYLNFGLNSPF